MLLFAGNYSRAAAAEVPITITVAGFGLILPVVIWMLAGFWLWRVR